MILKKGLVFILGLFLLTSCIGGPGPREFSGQTMGTTYSIRYFEEGSSLSEKELKRQVDEQLVKVNKTFSTYDPDSEISKINKSPANKELKLSHEFFYVLAHALELAKLSGGVFDPTIGPLVNLWGFGPDGKRKIPLEKELEETRNRVGYKKLKLDKTARTLVKTVEGMYLDFSATAKGYGVDRVADLLRVNGIKNAMVEIGGELKVIGTKNGSSWKIGIEKPVWEQGQLRKVQKIVYLKNGDALATSGDYRNFFTEDGKLYSHTIDVNTGKPVTGAIASVSVVSKNCMAADGLATMLNAMGQEKALKYAQSLNLDSYIIFRQTRNDMDAGQKEQLGVSSTGKMDSYFSESL